MSLSIPDADQKMSVEISKKLLKSIKTRNSNNKLNLHTKSIQKSKKKK